MNCTKTHDFDYSLSISLSVYIRLASHYIYLLPIMFVTASVALACHHDGMFYTRCCPVRLHFHFNRIFDGLALFQRTIKKAKKSYYNPSSLTNAFCPRGGFENRRSAKTGRCISIFKTKHGDGKETIENIFNIYTMPSRGGSR